MGAPLVSKVTNTKEYLDEDGTQVTHHVEEIVCRGRGVGGTYDLARHAHVCSPCVSTPTMFLPRTPNPTSLLV